MAILISPDLEAQATQKAQAEGLITEAYVERLIREDEEWRELADETIDETDAEFTAIHAAVQEVSRKRSGRRTAGWGCLRL